MEPIKIKEFISGYKPDNTDNPNKINIPELLKPEIEESYGECKDPEYKSWQKSCDELHEIFKKIINEDKKDFFGEIDILFEFKIFEYAWRCDVLLLGKKGVKDKILIIELKQWENSYVNRIEFQNSINDGTTENTSIDPVQQIRKYEEVLGKLSKVNEGVLEVNSCIWLFNYNFSENRSNDSLIKNNNVPDNIKIFGANDFEEFKEFLEEQFDGSSDTAYKNMLISKILKDGYILPSSTFKQGQIINGILHQLNDDDNKHNIFLVEGHPGTGKTVLALNLTLRVLQYFEKKYPGQWNLMVKYMTNNKTIEELKDKFLIAGYDIDMQTYDDGTPYSATLRNYLQKQYDKGVRPFMFGVINKFSAIKYAKKIYNCIIFDNAQKIPYTYNFDLNDDKKFEDTLVYMIKRTKNIIFLYDEDERFQINDVVLTDRLTKLVDENQITNVYIYPDILHDQLPYKLEYALKYAGENKTLNWIEKILGYDFNDNEEFYLPKEFEFKIVDTPDELFKYVGDHGWKTGRTIAGYCWPKKSEYNDQSKDFFEIEIKEKENDNKYQYRWTKSKDELDKLGIKTRKHFGNIYDVLGLSYNYCGIILGPDITYDKTEEKIKFNPDNNYLFKRYIKNGYETFVRDYSLSDQELKSVKSISKSSIYSERYDEAVELVRNQYYVLLTRAKKGCAVYCCDSALKEYLKGLVDRSVEK